MTKCEIRITNRGDDPKDLASRRGRNRDRTYLMHVPTAKPQLSNRQTVKLSNQKELP